jgi:hypothetical protein
MELLLHFHQYLKILIKIMFVKNFKLKSILLSLIENSNVISIIIKTKINI